MTRFLIACLIVAGVWGGVLPLLSRLATVQAMIDRNRRLDIDASAKFYSESESTRHSQTALSSVCRRHPAVLWTP